jgi:hypothetical protein
MADGNEHFFVPTPANTGLRGQEPSADGGVGDVTLRSADLGSFKSPSLRNVAVTAPYGHDGRFATLEALIDHYSDVRLLDPSHGYVIPAEPLLFTKSEKAAIIAFLKTLTDEKFLADPKFSNPFTITAAAPQVDTSSRIDTDVVVFTGNANPDGVLNRLRSFDRDGDDRLSSEELPERMQSLMKRADQNADGFLNAEEIVKVVKASTADQINSGSFRSKTATLADVVNDLKLPQPKHDRAIALAKNYAVPWDVNSPHSLAEFDLVSRLRELMDTEEYENFVAAARRIKNGQITFNAIR